VSNFIVYLLTLWEQQTDSLELLESYYLTKPNVRIFRGQHTLSYPQFGASFTTIEDIGDVLEEEDEPGSVLHRAPIWEL